MDVNNDNPIYSNVVELEDIVVGFKPIQIHYEMP